MCGFAGGCHGGMTDKSAPAVRRPSPKHVLETEENQTSLAVGRPRREVKIDSTASRPRLTSPPVGDSPLIVASINGQ